MLPYGVEGDVASNRDKRRELVIELGIEWVLAWTKVESHLQMFSFVQSHLRKIVKKRSRNVRVQRSESDHDIPAT